MTYQCSCDGRVITMDTRKYFQLSDADLMHYCTSGSGCDISDPWAFSSLSARGVDLTRQQEEIEEEEEYEEDESGDNPDLNLPPGFYEE